MEAHTHFIDPKENCGKLWVGHAIHFTKLLSGSLIKYGDQNCKGTDMFGGSWCEYFPRFKDV